MQGVRSGARVGAVFDIDGVLMRGKRGLPGAGDALRKLYAAGVPFVCVTNGGGVLEDVKAREVAQGTGAPLCGSQVVNSHSPLRALARVFSGRTLALGCRDVVGVARTYGLGDPVTPQMLARDDPTRYPFVAWPHEPLADRERPIEAVMVLHDPVDWSTDLQIACDVLRGGWPLGTGKAQCVPYVACNQDFVFAGSYPVPRFASGAFQRCLATLFQDLTGQPLRVTNVGKPHKITYDYARYALGRWRLRLQDAEMKGIGGQAFAESRVGKGFGPEFEAPVHLAPLATTQNLVGAVDKALGQVAHAAHALEQKFGEFDHIFMVGDNPASDIRGANAAKAPWHSILVRTGVFQGEGEKSNDRKDPAQFVVPSVVEAVDLILLAQSNPSSLPESLFFDSIVYDTIHNSHTDTDTGSFDFDVSIS